MLTYLLPIRLGILLQQILRGDQHAGRAKAALQGIAIAKGGLKIGDLAAVGQSLDGFDGCAMHLHREHQAGPNDFPIDAHCTRAANPVLATDMRSRQLQMFPQEVREIETTQNMGVDALAVDVERDWNGSRHPGLPAQRSGRPSSAETQPPTKTFAQYP